MLTIPQCSPGTPCPYCIKIFGPMNIAEVNCHRESPFVGYSVTDCASIFDESITEADDFQIFW